MINRKSLFENNCISQDNPDGFDLSGFVDLTWNESERKTVISYLKSFECVLWSPGIVWCRFRCRQKRIGGPYFFDDGFYRWSNIDLHYIESHYIKLPSEVITHILNRKHLIHTETYSQYIESSEEVKEFAKTQKTFLTPGFDGELWLIPSEFKVNSAVLKFFRQFGGLYDLSTKALIDYIRSDKKLLLEKKFDYADYFEIDKTAKDLGIILEFIEKD
ncbi:hypothetical protein [Pseudobacteroides cellulosolvens]|uniref:Uncharacterized protein n=1 Tax=Pseudobacteroides cellulosolvens ATCC 35603 = DSM 2933 TaxID=398512 RepID=A0A0L6JIG6_9FIRM|nr:hypothetical protein [Pseudobacteroides cellulosolvens]KNY25488.1 hypothetical protein Bccel_0748 [Pseudobacteroides cellulosolvens ATCC 35603 = DSM 2933]